MSICHPASESSPATLISMFWTVMSILVTSSGGASVTRTSRVASRGAGVGEGLGVGVRVGVAVGSGAEVGPGESVGVGAAVGVGTNVGASVDVGWTATADVGVGPTVRVGASVASDPPQAANDITAKLSVGINHVATLRSYPP
jgi:hypothetical protein